MATVVNLHCIERRVRSENRTKGVCRRPVHCQPTVSRDNDVAVCAMDRFHTGEARAYKAGRAYICESRAVQDSPVPDSCRIVYADNQAVRRGRHVQRVRLDRIIVRIVVRHSWPSLPSICRVEKVSAVTRNVDVAPTLHQDCKKLMWRVFQTVRVRVARQIHESLCFPRITPVLGFSKILCIWRRGWTRPAHREPDVAEKFRPKDFERRVQNADRLLVHEFDGPVDIHRIKVCAIGRCRHRRLIDRNRRLQIRRQISRDDRESGVFRTWCVR